MHAEINENPNLVQKVKKTKHKYKKTISKKFDKEGFFLAWGLVIVFAVIGIYIIWDIKTTQEVATQTTGYNISQHLVGFFPESVKETLIFILGSLFIFGAVYCIFIGLKIVAKYIAGKNQKYDRSAKSNFYKTGFRKLLSNKTSISE